MTSVHKRKPAVWDRSWKWFWCWILLSFPNKWKRIHIFVWLHFWTTFVKGGRTSSYLLHPEKLAKRPQVPFHFEGGRPNPSSLKLSAWGVIPGINWIQLLLIRRIWKNWFLLGKKEEEPVSKSATIISLSVFNRLFAVWGNPRKSQDLVVCSLWYWFGITASTSSMPIISRPQLSKINAYLNADIDVEGTCEKMASHTR